MRQCRYRCGVVCGRQPVLLSTMTLRSPPVPMQLTCWLIRTMPMSFLVVNDSNADSIAAVSVLLSTTKKFFSWSAPVLTCCTIHQ